LTSQWTSLEVTEALDRGVVDMLASGNIRSGATHDQSIPDIFASSLVTQAQA
jgi:hypothetical protein